MKRKKEHPLLHTYNEYLHFYKLIIEKYWGLLKPQLETLLRIYAFLQITEQINHLAILFY